MHIQVPGEQLDVIVSEDGVFLAKYDGVSYSAESLAKLRDKINRAVKMRTRDLEVPFTMIRLPQYGHTLDFWAKRATAHGLHPRNHQVLFRWDDTHKADRLGWYEARLVPGRLTDTELDTLLDLLAEMNSAQKAVHDFVLAHKLDLVREVQQAIEAATGSE